MSDSVSKYANYQMHDYTRLQTLRTLRISNLSLLLSDALAFILSAATAMFITFTASGHLMHQIWFRDQAAERYWAWFGLAVSGLVLFQARYQHYTDRKPFWTEVGEVVKICAVLALTDAAVLFLTNWNSSRMWWICTWVLSAILILICRVQVRHSLLRMGWWQRPTVLIGTGPCARAVLRALRCEPQLGLEIIGAVAADGGHTEHAHDELGANIPRLGAEHLQQLAIDRVGLQVVLALQDGEVLESEHWLRQLELWNLLDACVIPTLRGAAFVGSDSVWAFSNFLNEVALLRPRNSQRTWLARLMKRWFD